MRVRHIAVAVLSVMSLISLPTFASSALEELRRGTAEGEVKLNLRYRLEQVDQDGIDEEATASTVRGRLTFKSAKMGAWQYGVETDYVALIGPEDYNSTENGRTVYPVVADPEGFDLNQAFIKYTGDGFTTTAGRQRIVVDDQRFIGGVAWRQNEQTYDALSAEINATENLKFNYSYVWNVNRIFGPNDGAQPSDWHSNSHFLVASLAPGEKQSLEAFAYLLDFENDNGIPNSTATYGLTYRGEFGPTKLNATYATQSDYADSPLDYDADFIAIGGSLKAGAVSLSVGYELLGSDGGVAAFRTPLATLHKFQGWADKFLLTPADGIEDLYFGLSGSVGPVKLAATYHEFSADEGSANYGDEIDIVANYSPTKGVNLQLKYADYSADEFATATSKLWFSVIVNL